MIVANHSRSGRHLRALNSVRQSRSRTFRTLNPFTVVTVIRRWKVSVSDTRFDSVEDEIRSDFPPESLLEPLPSSLDCPRA
jgi:hypothetical protein